jgi:hypothetical protein
MYLQTHDNYNIYHNENLKRSIYLDNMIQISGIQMPDWGFDWRMAFPIGRVN